MLDQDVEAAVQAAKYQDLMERIDRAKALGHDLILRGARQIALYRFQDERRFKAVFSKERYPYTRDGAIYTLSVAIAERWQQYLIYCSVHGLDPIREAAKHGFGPPPKNQDWVQRRPIGAAQKHSSVSEDKKEVRHDTAEP
jgi:hypothetical protein